VLDPPATANAGEAISVPLTVMLGPAVDPQVRVTLDLETEGPVEASVDIDLGDLEPGSSASGAMEVVIDGGTADRPASGSLVATLALDGGEDTPDLRTAVVNLLEDGDVVWLGFVAPGDLERARLGALLDAGVISRAEYDEEYAATLEVVTGSVAADD
jgi:hypothetical protein